MYIFSADQREQLRQLIVSEPGIRTVQISDRLDADFDSVEDAIDVLADAGAIVRHKVLGPNNRQAIAYTAAGVSLPSSTAYASQVGAPPPALPVVPPALPDPAAAPVVEAAPSPWENPILTKIERATLFIKSNGGSASSSELHAMLKIKATDFVSSYLRDALNDGRLKKVGNVWGIGSGVPLRTRPVSASQVEGAPPGNPAQPVATSAPLSAAIDLKPLVPGALLPAIDIDAIHKVHKVPATPTLSSCIAFAVWSDGTLHITQEGQSSLILDQRNRRQLMRYLSLFETYDFEGAT